MSETRLVGLWLLAAAMTAFAGRSAAAERKISPQHLFGEVRKACGPAYFENKARFLVEVDDLAWLKQTRHQTGDPWGTRLAAIAVLDEAQDREKWNSSAKPFYALLDPGWGQMHITPKSERILYRADVTKLSKGSREHNTLVEVGSLSRGFLFEVLKKHTPDTLFTARAAALKKNDEWSQSDRETAFRQAHCLAARALALAGDEEAVGCLIAASQLDYAEQQRMCVAAEGLRHIGTQPALRALSEVPNKYRWEPRLPIDQVLLQPVDVKLNEDGSVVLVTGEVNYLRPQDYCDLHQVYSRTSPFFGRICALKNGDGSYYWNEATRLGMLKVIEADGNKLLCRIVSNTPELVRRSIETALQKTPNGQPGFEGADGLRKKD